MTEERKFAILFAATILAARRLIDLDPDKPNMAKGYFVGDSFGFVLRRVFPAVKWAEQGHDSVNQ